MKIGIVFEGGASRTSFTNGVIDVLLREGIRADYVIGTSAGIANGISYVSGQRGRNLKVSLRYMPDRRYMGKRYLLKRGNRSYYNIDFVFNQVPNQYVPFDYEAFHAFPGDVLACVTNMETGKAEYLPVTGENGEWRELVATCALPLLFQPVTIDGKRYLDGGVANPVPFEKALRDGCDKVIVVLTRERSYRKSEHEFLTDASAATYRKYPAFARKLIMRGAIYNRQREQLFAREREGKVFLITPDTTRHFKRTENDPAEMLALYRQGVRCTEARMMALRRYLGE